MNSDPISLGTTADGSLAGEAGRSGSSPAVFSPTEKQLEILRYIVGFIEANGEPPSFREMVEGLGYSSTSIPWQLFYHMRGKGLLRRIKGEARAIEVLVPVAIPRGPRGEPLQFIKINPARSGRKAMEQHS